MAKIFINGEGYDFDGGKTPMSEALVIERELGIRYTEYEEDLQAGSMKALAGFVWMVLHRNGRDVKLADILSGDFEVEVIEVLESMQAAAQEAKAAALGVSIDDIRQWAAEAENKRLDGPDAEKFIDARAAEARAQAPDPTARAAAPRSAKGGTPTTPTSTRGRSRAT